MTETVELALDQFARFSAELGPNVEAESLAPDVLLLKPKGQAAFSFAGKSIALTLMGITHGNEVAGLGVLSDILGLIAAKVVTPKIPVAFVLGNRAAALQGKRFVDRDLNRSFAQASGGFSEQVRARELAQVLKNTAFFLDYHQTSRPVEQPFFIFPYAKKSFEFARAISPPIAIVTHWGKPFSSEGMCTDEFVNSEGGTGISLELGQNGFDPVQIALGVSAGLWAMSVVESKFSDPETGRRSFARGTGRQGDIFTWAEIVPWPAQGFVELKEGWNNFQDVEHGTQLGLVGGQPLLAPTSGKILFPKYLPREAQETSRPRELCRIIKTISQNDLPT